jgi:hypothetical protein
MKNPNTGIPEFVVLPQYDIYAVAAGGTSGYLQLFSLQVGAAYAYFGITSFNKTLNHTTLQQAGMLQSSYTYIVRAISVYVSGNPADANAPYCSVADTGNLLATLGTFNINDKVYSQGIIGWLPAGGGVHSTGTGTASNITAQNGWPVTHNIYEIPGGQYINPQETFNFTIDPTKSNLGTGWVAKATAAGAASGIMAWVRFDGTLIRVAQ